MQKPQLQTTTYEYYYYFQVRDYFKEKYPEFNERKVWRHIIESGDVSNGGYFWITATQGEVDAYREDDEYGKYDDYAYFLELLIAEFGEDEYQFYVSW